MTDILREIMSPEWKGNEIAVSGKLTLHLSLNFAQLEEQRQQQQQRAPHPAKHFPPIRLLAAKRFYLPVARTTGSLAALFVWLAGASANTEATCFTCADRTRTRANRILYSLTASLTAGRWLREIHAPLSRDSSARRRAIVSKIVNVSKMVY